MRALSVKQPWATLIATGRKTLEVRSRATRYRGPLLIVSSLSPDPRLTDWQAFDGPRGAAIALVELVDCRLGTPADADAACVEPPAGHFVWVLANARPVANTPIRGRLGLYEVSDTLVAPQLAR